MRVGNETPDQGDSTGVDELFDYFERVDDKKRRAQQREEVLSRGATFFGGALPMRVELPQELAKSLADKYDGDIRRVGLSVNNPTETEATRRIVVDSERRRLAGYRIVAAMMRPSPFDRQISVDFEEGITFEVSPDEPFVEQNDLASAFDYIPPGVLQAWDQRTSQFLDSILTDHDIDAGPRRAVAIWALIDGLIIQYNQTQDSRLMSQLVEFASHGVEQEVLSVADVLQANNIAFAMTGGGVNGKEIDEEGSFYKELLRYGVYDKEQLPVTKHNGVLIYSGEDADSFNGFNADRVVWHGNSYRRDVATLDRALQETAREVDLLGSGYKFNRHELSGVLASTLAEYEGTAEESSDNATIGKLLDDVERFKNVVELLVTLDDMRDSVKALEFSEDLLGDYGFADLDDAVMHLQRQVNDMASLVRDEGFAELLDQGVDIFKDSEQSQKLRDAMVELRTFVTEKHGGTLGIYLDEWETSGGVIRKQIKSVPVDVNMFLSLVNRVTSSLTRADPEELKAYGAINKLGTIGDKFIENADNTYERVTHTNSDGKSVLYIGQDGRVRRVVYIPRLFDGLEPEQRQTWVNMVAADIGRVLRDGESLQGGLSKLASIYNNDNRTDPFGAKGRKFFWDIISAYEDTEAIKSRLYALNSIVGQSMSLLSPDKLTDGIINKWEELQDAEKMVVIDRGDDIEGIVDSILDDAFPRRGKWHTTAAYQLARNALVQVVTPLVVQQPPPDTSDFSDLLSQRSN